MSSRSSGSASGSGQHSGSALSAKVSVSFCSFNGPFTWSSKTLLPSGSNILAEFRSSPSIRKWKPMSPSEAFISISALHSPKSSQGSVAVAILARPTSAAPATTSNDRRVADLRFMICSLLKRCMGAACTRHRQHVRVGWAHNPSVKSGRGSRTAPTTAGVSCRSAPRQAIDAGSRFKKRSYRFV